MLLLELLSRVYGEGREAETFQAPEEIDETPIQRLALETYERSLGIGRAQAYREEAVGSVAEFAAAGRKIVDVEGISIGVFHVDGQWHALQNSCLHRGGPVCNGSLENGILTCPWHDSCFNVTDGAVLKGPATEPLKTYRVVVDGDVGRVEG